MKLNELVNLKRAVSMVEGEEYTLNDLEYRRVPDRNNYGHDADGLRGCIVCNSDKGAVYLPNTIVHAYEEMAAEGATIDECNRLLIGHKVRCVRVKYSGKSFLTLQWLDK